MNERTLCFLVWGNPSSEVLLGLKKTGFGLGKYAGFGGGVEIGQLTFSFPSKPAWSQIVHVFLVETWQGDPEESDEMKPAWRLINEIPFEKMWGDASYWLPFILRGKRIRASFVYQDDNETVGEADVEDWEDGK